MLGGWVDGLNGHSMTDISCCEACNELIDFYRGGHTTIAQILLHHSPPDLIKEVDVYGRTSLIEATSGGYVECAKFLVENVSFEIDWAYHTNHKRVFF